MKLIGSSHRIFLREDAKPCVFQFPNKTWGVFQTLVSVVGCVWFPPSHCLKGLEVWRWEGTEVLYNTVPIFSYKACTRAQIGWFLLVNHRKEPLCSSQWLTCSRTLLYIHRLCTRCRATWGPFGVNHQHFSTSVFWLFTLNQRSCLRYVSKNWNMESSNTCTGLFFSPPPQKASGNK